MQKMLVGAATILILSLAYLAESQQNHTISGEGQDPTRAIRLSELLSMPIPMVTGALVPSTRSRLRMGRGRSR